MRAGSSTFDACAWYVFAFASICSRDSGGRMSLRPDGSPIIDVKSPIRKITWWPRSCIWRILLSTTVCPRWMSGAVGSSPSLIRSGWLVNWRARASRDLALDQQFVGAALEHGELVRDVHGHDDRFRKGGRCRATC